MEKMAHTALWKTKLQIPCLLGSFVWQVTIMVWDNLANFHKEMGGLFLLGAGNLFPPKKVCNGRINIPLSTWLSFLCPTYANNDLTIMLLLKWPPTSLTAYFTAYSFKTLVKWWPATCKLHPPWKKWRFFLWKGDVMILSQERTISVYMFWLRNL